MQRLQMDGTVKTKAKANFSVSSRLCLSQLEKAAWLMALPPVLAVVLCFIIPYFAVFSGAFQGGMLVLKYPALPAVTFFTLKQAFFSALVSLVIGLPGAWFIGSARSPLLKAVTAIPFAMPSILTVLGFVLFYGNSGWLNRFIVHFQLSPLRILYKPQALILAHGFLNFPLVIRLMGDGLGRARRAYASAAAALGAPPLVAALTVTLPLTLPVIMSAALLAFLYSFTSFAVVLVLGGVSSTTLAVEIYRNARIFLNYRNAGTLALVETLIAFSVFIAFIFLRRKSATVRIEERPIEENAASLSLRIIMAAYCVLATLFTMGPIVSLLIESMLLRSASNVSFSLRWWLGLGETCLPAFLRSIALAFSAASLACVLAFLAAGALKFFDNIGNRIIAGFIRFCGAVPIISSGIVLGLGWLIVYGGKPSRSPLALITLHTLIAFPFTFYSVSEGFRSLPENILNAALVSGANPFRSLFTVALPLSMPRLRSAWGIAAALSLGEPSSAMMLGWETLPLYIYRAAGAYRYGTACAAGALLILAFAAVLFLSEVFGRKRNPLAWWNYGP
jgi:thiamine transport system permease protein